MITEKQEAFINSLLRQTGQAGIDEMNEFFYRVMQYGIEELTKREASRLIDRLLIVKNVQEEMEKEAEWADYEVSEADFDC